MNYGVFLSPSSSVSTIINNSSIWNHILSSNSRYKNSIGINLNIVITASVTDTIVQHADILTARERISNKEIDGNIFKDLINDAETICWVMFLKR